MPGQRIVSLEQYVILIGELEQRPDMAKGRLSNSSSGDRRRVLDWWDALANKLNAVFGCHKTGKEWKQYWNDQKYSVRRKAAKVRSHRTGTGGGPPSRVALNEYEQRVLALLGPQSVYGIADVRVPFGPHEDGPSGIPTAQPVLPTATPSPSPRPTPPANRSEPTHPAPDHAYPVEILGEDSDSDSNQSSSAGDRRGGRATRPYQHRTGEPPQWALDMEERRLRAQESTAESLRTISEQVGELNSTMRALSENVNRLFEFLGDMMFGDSESPRPRRED